MDKNDKNATSLNDLFALYESEMKVEQKPKQQQVIEPDEEVDVVAAVKEEVTPPSIIESTLSILAASSSKKKDNPKKNNSLMENAISALGHVSEPSKDESIQYATKEELRRRISEIHNTVNALGGGGEVRLKHLDDVVYSPNASIGQYLASGPNGKFIFIDPPAIPDIPDISSVPTADETTITENEDGSLSVINLPQNTAIGPVLSIGVDSIDAQTVSFDTSGSFVQPTDPGSLAWNSDDDTLNLILAEGSVLQIGQETLFRVQNNTGATLVNGSLLAFAGTIGNSGKLRAAMWTCEYGVFQSDHIMGIATGNIPDGETGYCTHFGLVRGLNCSGSTENETWTNGDVLYACSRTRDPEGVYGLTNVPPEAPGTKSSIAVVVSNHAVNGSLFVRPSKSPSLRNDELVELSETINNSAVLAYNTVNERFEDTSDLSLSTMRVGTETNYSEFEADGTLVAHGAATYWQDLDFPIIIRTTGPNIPTLVPIQGNISAPQWDVNDFSVCEGQELVHAWKEGSEIHWHIHLTTNGTDTTDRYVRFEIEWFWGNPFEQLSETIITDSGDLLIPANTPTKTMRIDGIGSRVLTDGRIGGHIWTRLRRIASTGTAPSNNPWVTMLQAHIECDTFGSRDITSK